jgi:sporulation protein YlmC with PRC-barrel domain
MNMVLYTELKDYDVVDKLGKEVGKIDDLIVDLSSWEITGIKLSHGILRKKVIHKLEHIEKTDEHEKKITIPSNAPEEEPIEKSSFTSALMDDDLIHKEVVSSDNNEIGKVYDVDIPIKLKHWKVWKILIKRGMKERRLRIAPDEIESVSEEIKLKKSLSEIDVDKDEDKK